MKQLILSTLIIFNCFTLYAQSLLPNKYGLKVGVNISNINTYTIEGVDGIKAPTSYAKTGIVGGFYMQIPLNDKLYITPELLYSQKAVELDYNYTHDYPVNQRDEYMTTNKMKIIVATIIIR